MMKWLFWTKTDWRLVKSLNINVIRGTANRGIVFVHFYESEGGRRKYKLGTTFMNPRELEATFKTFSEYHTVVVPWLNGRFSPDIPRYLDVDADEVTAKLSTS